MIRRVPGLLDETSMEAILKRFETHYLTMCDASYCRNIFDCVHDPVVRPIADRLEETLKRHLPPQYHMSRGKGAIVLIDAPSFQRNQMWHRDGDHENISIFVPCVDVSKNGALQILPQSEDLEPRMWRSRMKDAIECHLRAGTRCNSGDSYTRRPIFGSQTSRGRFEFRSRRWH